MDTDGGVKRSEGLMKIFKMTGEYLEQIPINIEGFSDEFRDLLQINQRAGKALSVIFDANSSNGSAFQRASFKKN